MIALTTAAPAKTDLDPVSEDFYKYARYLFTKSEKKIFKNLPTVEERHRFIDYFWEIRDPNPLTEENEFKDEMQQRFDFVSRYLKEGPVPGWKTDRGRIYILLGPPDERLENFYSNSTPYMAIVYWYYGVQRILVAFVDDEGTGTYRMDLRVTSLRLLDELERRKHYIANKEDGEFAVKLLKFEMVYRKDAKDVVFNVAPRNVNFENAGKDRPSKVMTKFKIDLMVYYGKNQFTKHSQLKTVYLDEKDLLKKGAKIEIKFPLTLPEGKVKIDAIVSDFLGDATRRKLITVKNR
ncbi:MAG: GWxTD domain-containing protein [bacterium]|nr:GWxTD domain-containing protein [bacterium]